MQVNLLHVSHNYRRPYVKQFEEYKTANLRLCWAHWSLRFGGSHLRKWIWNRLNSVQSHCRCETWSFPFVHSMSQSPGCHTATLSRHQTAEVTLWELVVIPRSWKNVNVQLILGLRHSGRPPMVLKLTVYWFQNMDWKKSRSIRSIGKCRLQSPRNKPNISLTLFEGFGEKTSTGNRIDCTL